MDIDKPMYQIGITSDPSGTGQAQVIVAFEPCDSESDAAKLAENVGALMERALGGWQKKVGEGH